MHTYRITYRLYGSLMTMLSYGDSEEHAVQMSLSGAPVVSIIRIDGGDV